MEASQADKNIYGEDVRLHPITKMPFEQGRGCLPDDVQAYNVHLVQIHHMHGEKAAADMRRKLDDAKTIKAAQEDMNEEDHGPGSL